MTPLNLTNRAILDAPQAVVRVAMNNALDGISFRGMTFLNEAIVRYPKAISLAAGRPPDHLLETARTTGWLHAFIAASARLRDGPWEQLGQYAETAGIIRQHAAEYIQRLEDIPARAEECVITNGFQEALLLELIALARRGGAIITMDPTYVGLMGAAAAAGLPLYAFDASSDPASQLRQAARLARADGAQRVAFYLIPDFANPTGDTLGETARERLLEVADEEDVLLLEDTAYRWYRYDGHQARSLLRLDTGGRVVQLNSFSKTFLPGVRVGFSITRANGPGERSRADVIGLKSFTSVTTSPIAQAITAGFLLETNFDIAGWIAPRVAYCRTNRDRMLAALKRELGGTPSVRWSRPEGGFFIVLSLPFEFGEADMIESAEVFGVIVTPMMFFSTRGGSRDLVRMSFSSAAPDAIDVGVRRFADYIRSRVGRNG